MKFKLIFIYFVALIYLISIGLTYVNPNFIVMSLISMGFIFGFMANESFFKDEFTSNEKPSIIPITEGNTLSNIKTNYSRQMPIDPPPSLSMNKIDCLKLSVERLVLLHKLFNMGEGDSIPADKIRDELEDLAKQIPEENEWMRKLFARLYELVEKLSNKNDI